MPALNVTVVEGGVVGIACTENPLNHESCIGIGKIGLLVLIAVS